MGWGLLRRDHTTLQYLHIKLPGPVLPSKGEDQNAVIFSFNPVVASDSLKRDASNPDKNGNKPYLCGCYVLAFFSQFGP